MAEKLEPSRDGEPSYTLKLDDPHFETAPVFRAFLDLVSDGTLDFKCGSPYAHLLVSFLRKWDSPVMLKLLLFLVTDAAIDHRLEPIRAFAICAAAEDLQGCSTVLRRTTFGDYDGIRAPEASDWPIYMWTDVPGVWLMALSRACAEHQACRGRRDYKHLVETSFRLGLEAYRRAMPTPGILLAPCNDEMRLRLLYRRAEYLSDVSTGPY
jgi:hypothetical protein